MAMIGPVTIHNAEVSASGLSDTIDLKSVNGTGYEALNGCAIGGAWTTGVAANIDFTSADINATTNVISIVAHGGLTGDKVRVTTTGTLPKPLLALTDYWLIYLTDNTFQLASSLANALAGTAINLLDDIHTLTPVASSAKTFTDTEINAGTEEITIALHGYRDGQLVSVSTDGGLPTGLPAGDSWVIVVDPNTIKLASSLANAVAGTPRDLTADGSGTHTLTPPTVAVQTFTDFRTNSTADTLSISTHSYFTGLQVTLSTAGTLPGGLVAGNHWIIVVDPNTIKLALSLADASTGTQDDITSAAGEGTHTLTATAAAGTANIEESLDGTLWMPVTSTYGGSSQNIAAVSQFIWSYSGKCRYLRLNIAPTAGRVTATIKFDTPIWSD